MPLPRIDRWFCRWRRTRDPRLLGDVFDRTAPELLRVARHLTCDVHRAEDLVQSTFLSAIEKAEQYDAARPLLPWLLAILANLAREAQRRERRPLPTARGEEDARDLGDHAAARELAEVCDRALEALPEPYRHVLILHLRHGMAAHEIAQALQRPDSTVRNQIARGLNHLRRRLPASAAPAALLLPGRGLAAVRAEVFAHASGAAAAATAMVGIGGPLMSKKIVLPFVLLIAAGAWYATTSGPGIPAVPPPPPSTPAVLSAPPAPSAAIDTPAMAPAQREPLADAAGARVPGPTELWGRVVQARTGIPIAGADVRLLHRNADEFWNLDIEYGEHIEELARTTSDAECRFAFDVARGRAHRVGVRAVGFADACATSCTGGGEVVVEMDLGAVLKGSTRDAVTGKQVADVDLRVVRRADRVELARGRSGADGGFRFEGLPAGAVMLRAEPAHHASSGKELSVEAGRTHQVALELTTGVVLRGRVLDAVTRDPVALAEVSDSWTFRHRTRSDEKGEFELACTDSPFTRVYARAPGYANESLALPRPTARRTEILLVRGGSVTGRFTEPDGAPLRVQYAAVAASHGQGEVDWLRAEVGVDGRFVASDVRSDLHYWLYARCSGYGTLVLALPRPIASSEQLDVGTVALASAAAIEGKVVDGEGRVIGDETVHLQTPYAYTSRGGGEGPPPPPVVQLETTELRTDAAGRFCFPDLAAGTYDVSVRIGRDDSARASVTVTEGALREGVVLVMPAGLAIAGVIRRNNGVPLGDTAGLVVVARSASSSASAFPAADGSFRITGLAAGDYDLFVLGYGAGWVLPSTPRVAAGTNEVQLVLEPAATIRGRVLDDEGKPASAIVTFFVPGVTAGRSSATKSDGTFELHVPPGSVGRISASDPVLSVKSAEIDGVAAGQDGLELRLRLPLVLHGR